MKKDSSSSEKKSRTTITIVLASASVSVMAAVFSSLVLYYRPKETLTLDRVVTFMGLFFTIVGVIATIFFVVLSYRARLIRDELMEEKNNAEIAIKESHKQWEVLVSAAMDILYQNYSFLIKENPKRISEYRLQASRLACRLTLLEPKERLEGIELIGTIYRPKDGREWNEIDDDIKLLEDVLFSNDEPEVIKRKAKKALEFLEEKKQ